MTDYAKLSLEYAPEVSPAASITDAVTLRAAVAALPTDPLEHGIARAGLLRDLTLPPLDMPLPEARELLHAAEHVGTACTFAMEPVSALPDPDVADREWTWDGYVGPGVLTLLAGWMKLGKSTLAAQLTAAVIEGLAFCGRKTTPTGCAWFNCAFEQSRDEIKRAFTKLGVADDVWYVDAPNGWTFDTATVVKELRAQGVGLVVVDSLAKAWRCIVTDENDAAQVERGMMPFLELARAGFAVVLLHHTRKSGGEDGTNIRGSGAVLAAVDIGITFERFDGKTTPTRRRLIAQTRFGDVTPAAYVLDYLDGIYTGLGLEAEVQQQSRQERIRADQERVWRALGDEWDDLDAITEAVNADDAHEVSKGTVRNRLRDLVGDDRAARQGMKKYEWRRVQP